MDKKSKLIKSIVKQNVAPKDTFGTNPMDPWSTKANITEDRWLDKFLNSRGINPKFVTKDTKVAHSKSNEFKKWKQDHEGIQLEDSVSEGILKNVKRWVSNKDAGSRAGQEVGKMMSAQHSGDVKTATKHMNRYKKLSALTKEETDKEDTVTLDIPLMIRMLEYAREDAKTDMDLHNVVTKLIQIRNNGVLTMKDYDFLVKLKEDIDLGFKYELIEAKEYNAMDTPEFSDALAKMKAKVAKAPPVDMNRLIARLKAYSDSEKLRKKQLAVEESGFKVYGNVNGKDFTTMEHHKPEQIHKNNSNISREEAHVIHKHLQSDDYLDSRSNRYGINSKGRYGDHRVVVDGRKLHNEDVYQDPHAATQTVFDGANNTDDTSVRRTQLSKSARMIKALYKSKGMKEERELEEATYSIKNTKTGQIYFHSKYPINKDNERLKKIQSAGGDHIHATPHKDGKPLSETSMVEDMHDWEKEDKSVASPGRKPKMQNAEKQLGIGTQPKAAAVMTGGKTLTGTQRDDIEIDPVMKNRPGANPDKMNQQNQQKV